MNNPKLSLRPILLPGEHGGWAFQAEPVLLGQPVGFSGAGPAIALAERGM